jgi:hypothetical protein
MANANGNINILSTTITVDTGLQSQVNYPKTIYAQYLRGEYIEVYNAYYFKTDLSKILNIIRKPSPVFYGLSIFNRVKDVEVINIDDIQNPDCKNTYKLVDGGDAYELEGGISEKQNYGWLPRSNSELFTYVERSDIDSFDLPEVTIRGTRRIPTGNVTLCGENSTSINHRNYNWFFGHNAWIDFNPIENGITPISLSGALYTIEGSSAISDIDGDLLFYSDGVTIYNQNHSVMSNGSGLEGFSSSTQSVLIVPRPDTNKFYVFTTNHDGASNGFKYSVVNMDLDGGLGQVEAKNITLLSSPLTEKVTGTFHSDGENYWVITHTSGDSKYYTYEIATSGISSPIISDVGVTHNTQRGYMKTSIDGSKIASALYDEGTVEILDFNNTGGTISNPITLTGLTFTAGPYGLEFSSDSSKLYVTDGAYGKIYQLDLTYTASTDMIENVKEIIDITGATMGALQMGPDEKIYVADKDKKYLHLIHNPNGLGYNCNFETSGFTLTEGSGVGCPVGWDLNPDETMCFSATTTSVTYNGTVYTAYTGNLNIGYNNNGALFYDEQPEELFPLQLTGTSTVLRDFSGSTIASTVQNTTSPLWDSLLSTSNGRLNNVGVWGTPATSPNNPVGEWIGFSFCLEIQKSGKYLVGLSADNRTRFRINGELIFTSEPLNSGSNADLGYWRVFCYDFMSGENIIEMEAINDGAAASFGCEVYSGTIQEISGYTTESQLEPHILFSTKDYRYETNGNIVKLFDLGESSGYSCPSGYTLDNCGESPICRKTVYTATTFTGSTSQWGLPNSITDSILSCERYVYIRDSRFGEYDFDLTINNNNGVIEEKQLDYYAEIYKYNTTTGNFNSDSLYTTDVIPYSSTTASTLTIPVNSIGEGEFIIKSYYQYPLNTVVNNELNSRNDSINTYKTGKEYSLYNPDTDWYFINLFQADTPIFSKNGPEGVTFGALKVESQLTELGVSAYTYPFLGNIIVSYNGSVLAKDLDYYESGNTINLTIEVLDAQVLTVAYSRGGNVNLYADSHTVTSINSGVTDGQLDSDKIYLNTDTGKYEYYLDADNYGDIIMTVNGSPLINGVEYYKSTTNNRRVIFDITINVNDIITAFYYPQAEYVGSISVPSPVIGWTIDNAPTDDIDGTFTVEVALDSDTDFSSILYSASTDYVTGSVSYSVSVPFSGVTFGDEFIYRVKNEKRYTPISGEVIKSISYSEVLPITVITNEINSY